VQLIDMRGIGILDMRGIAILAHSNVRRLNIILKARHPCGVTGGQSLVALQAHNAYYNVLLLDEVRLLKTVFPRSDRCLN
jgi:hypothetical protein